MRDKIWFTYKARIQASQRLERMQFHSQWLLAWYAFLVASLSVATIRYPSLLGGPTDVLAAILSLALLAISLLVAKREFRGRAILMRLNYLRLQELYDTLPKSEEIGEEGIKEYHRLLREAENHSEIDDINFRVFAAKGVLETRLPTTTEFVKAYLFVVAKSFSLLVLYLAPVIAALAAWKLL